MSRPSFWQREPALLVGQVQTLIGIATAAGFAPSNHVAAIAIGAATAVADFAVVGIRQVVSSPATAAALAAARDEKADQAASAQGVVAMYSAAGATLPVEDAPEPVGPVLS